jgi:alpha-L-fucosidase
LVSSQNTNTSCRFVIDLGKEVTLTGFKYLPWQSTDGVISKYQFSVSLDGNNWTIVNEGEFSNIKNNPLLQVKTFTPSKAKFIKFTALKNTKNDNWAGYAELDVITK